jgi:phenylacetate-coenzyme A ligase PaaK-like adenylate-forming protein
VGRTADFLYRPDGTPVFGISILDTFVIHIKGLKQVQIIQDKYNHLDFLVVRDQVFSDESVSHLGKNVLDIFGPEMTWDIEYVDAIPLTERGKFRFSICNINTGHQS